MLGFHCATRAPNTTTGIYRRDLIFARPLFYSVLVLSKFSICPVGHVFAPRPIVYFARLRPGNFHDSCRASPLRDGGCVSASMSEQLSARSSADCGHALPAFSRKIRQICLTTFNSSFAATSYDGAATATKCIGLVTGSKPQMHQ